ncbi:MAG: insulinase family protein, partial [Thermoproteus sp.]|nr:insulinase family protein [Thermoproteus sp.]
MRKSFRAEKLDNGVTLLADVFPSSLAALVVGIRTGPLYEARSEKGYSHLLEHMLFNVEGFDVDAAVEGLGGESNAYTHRDVVMLTFQALAESFKGLVDAAVRVLANRRYDERRFEREKLIVLSEMRMNRESPSERIGDLGLRALFGDGDWGIPIDGLPEVISAATLRDLLEFKEKWIKPDNIIVAVAGGIGEGELEEVGR